MHAFPRISLLVNCVLIAFLSILLLNPPKPSVNLPLPAHTCKAVVQASGIHFPTRRDASFLGQLYAGALRLNGATGNNKVTFLNTLQAFSDVTGCFVAPTK